LILLLKTEYAGKNEIPYPVKFFLDIDPFIALMNLLVLHALPSVLFLSLIIVGLTLVFGRFFCSWVCPFGAMNELVYFFKKDKLGRGGKEFQRFKYYLLVGLILAAFFSLQMGGMFDPISLSIRSFSISILPATNLLIRNFFDSLFSVEGIRTFSEPIYGFLKAHFLSFEQPYFRQAAFIGLIFFGLLFINLYQRRFWCRSLCPLGALLGFISKVSVLRLQQRDECDGCGVCARGCQGGADPDKIEGWKAHECYVCGNCTASCPKKTLSFKFSKPFYVRSAKIDLKRRYLFYSILAGMGIVPIVRVGPKDKVPNPDLIRPPGAVEEGEFLNRCVRCGECMKVCLTNGLQPTLFEAGLEGIWTPMFDFKLGYCEYNCTLCGQVCPSQAIEELSVEEKQKVKIGLAFVDRGRCIPYILGEECLVCHEHCPTPKKAIILTEQDSPISRKRVRFPSVDPELCIGCGICENRCPLVDRPAIRVSSIGESRSQKNQFIIY